jgi:hypothetical protein
MIVLLNAVLPKQLILCFLIFICTNKNYKCTTLIVILFTILHPSPHSDDKAH